MFLNKKTNKSAYCLGRQIVVFGALILAFFCFVSVNKVIAEDTISGTLSGLDSAATEAYGADNINQVSKSVPELIGQVVGSALAFIGILFLLLMIYAGILWMTARGNEQSVTKAQDLITAAVIGLVIVLSAYAITAYIGAQLTNQPVSVSVSS